MTNITLQSGDREFKATFNTTEEAVFAIRDGLIAMGYHPSTARKFIEEIVNQDE